MSANKNNHDVARGFWIVGDDAYDLTPFIPHHPGGAAFLTRSRNRDITVAVNTYHPNPDKLKPILEKYWHHRAKQSDLNKHLSRLRLNFLESGFSAQRDIPSYDFSNPDHILPKVRKVLGTPEWKSRLDRADMLFDVTTGAFLVLYFVLQWMCLSGKLGWMYFTILIVVTRLALTGAGHYSLHRAFKWPNVVTNHLFDLSYVVYGFSAWDGHTLIHHLYTMTGGDVKKVSFNEIMSLPRFARIPVHTFAKFGEFICGIFVRGFIFSKRGVKLHFIPSDMVMQFFIPFLIWRILLVVEMVAFITAGLWHAWLLQYCVTLWINTFQAIDGHDFHEEYSKPDLTSGQDWAAFQIINTVDSSYTGNVWLDCWLSAGLNTHRIHHVLPYQRSGYANILSEPVLRKIAKENGIEWQPTENFFVRALPRLLGKYVFGKPTFSQAKDIWAEHLSIHAVHKCVSHILAGFLGYGI